MQEVHLDSVSCASRRFDLQAVRQASEEQEAMFNAEAVAARQAATAIMLLPKLFDSVRAAFGPSGPSVMPLQKVSSFPFLFNAAAASSHTL